MPDPARVVVSDTGPFITLEKLPGGFELLRQLYDRVLLPKQVLAELAQGRASGTAYLREFDLEGFVDVVPVRVTDPDLAELDPGSSEGCRC